MGSPCAVKAARTVATGGMGKHNSVVRPVPTHWESRPRGEGRQGIDALRVYELLGA
jgi:hypothetical protein